MTFIKRATKRLLSPKGIKISLSILLISVFFFSPTFAQDSNEVLQKANLTISRILEFLSRSRIVLASIAWKLMTNDMVYGSWMHLDEYLWKLRNICKNFANFGLLAVLLRGIIKFITKPWEDIKKVVTSTLIAWILIQASWFLVAAVLDVSTILTAAVWSFPSSFINSNTSLKNAIPKTLAKDMHTFYLKIHKDGQVSKEEKTATNLEMDPNREEDFIEKIMPKNDSVWWVLVYIWATTLNIQKVLDNPKGETKLVKQKITWSLLQFLMIWLFSITLILLIIANIIRIALLWIFIPLSPIIILIIAVWWKSLFDNNALFKNFNTSVILNAIFKPVLFTAVMWLMLIFIVSMQKIMNGNENMIELQWTRIWIIDSTATIENEDVFSVKINDSLFKEAESQSKNIFSSLIIYFATIFILRYLVKIAAKRGWGTIWDAMKKATDTVEWMAKTVPMFGGYSAAALQWGGGNILKWVGKSLGVDMDFRSWTAGKLASDQNFRKFLDEKFKITSRYDEDYKNLRDSNNFIDTTKTLINTKKRDDENISRREGIFNQRLTKKEIGIIDPNSSLFNNNNEKTLANMNPDWFKLLHKELGWWWNEPQNREQFIKKLKNWEYKPS